MPSKKYLNEVGLAYFWEKIKSLANDVYLYSKSYTDNKINNLNVVIDIAGNTAENADEDEYTSDEAYFLCRRYLQDGKDWHTPYTNSEISDLLGSNSDTEVHIRFEHPETYAVITMRLYSDLYTNNNTYYFIAPTEEGCYYASNSFNGTGIDPDANAYIDIYYRTYDSASDWEQDDSTASNYIQNRPAIRAGTGNVSIIENDLEENIASGVGSHAEGTVTTASGSISHAEGGHTIASGSYSHVEGYYTKANGNYSHAEGYGNISKGDRSHTEGIISTTIGNNSHAEGTFVYYSSHITGEAGATTYTVTKSTPPMRKSSGYSQLRIDTRGGGSNSFNAKYVVIPTAVTITDDHVTAFTLEETLDAENAIDRDNMIYYGSYAEGEGSHSEGIAGVAFGKGAHAEGRQANAYGLYSHAENNLTVAKGLGSHAEGSITYANSTASHSEGIQTIASSEGQHVQGKYNIEDSSSTYAHIVGNGTSDSARSNAHTLDWAGNGWYAGKLTVGSAPTANMDVATKIYVDNLAATAEDDEEILNLLTEYGYYAPVTDADGNVVTDIDNNIILG